MTWITVGQFLIQNGASIVGLINTIRAAQPAMTDSQLNTILLGVIDDATTRKTLADRDAGAA